MIADSVFLNRLRFFGLGILVITSGPRNIGNFGGGMEGQSTAAKAVASLSSVPFIAARKVGTISVEASWFQESQEMQCLRCSACGANVVH